MFITFIYRIDNNPKTYFGKYCTDYISDDHEGLDNEIVSDLLDGINKYQKQKKLEEVQKDNIHIGVLSFSSNKFIPVYSSHAEIKCFDYYREYYDDIKTNVTYINGKPV
jgi:hypothetical protein